MFIFLLYSFDLEKLLLRDKKDFFIKKKKGLSDCNYFMIQSTEQHPVAAYK